MGRAAHLPMGSPPHLLFGSFSITAGRNPTKLSPHTPSICSQVVLVFDRNRLETAKVDFCPSLGRAPHGGLPMKGGEGKSLHNCLQSSEWCETCEHIVSLWGESLGQFHPKLQKLDPKNAWGGLPISPWGALPIFLLDLSQQPLDENSPNFHPICPVCARRWY
jgi:hypothetical protein